MERVLDLGSHPLVGRFVALEPLAPSHFEPLAAASADPDVWRFMPIDGAGPAFAAMWQAMNAEVARGERIAYAVRRLSDQAIVGSTSYLAIAPAHGRVEIGATWLASTAQGCAINPDAKRLLLAHAFEACRYHRVELKCDARNLRSRAAIAKLGATEEGTLRGHMWVHRGYWRDTVYYSLLAEEWPAAKAALDARLARFDMP